jgi:glycosyltransferase involved in cell wall biosynthesis
MRPFSRALMITPTDYEQMSNDHDRVRHYVPKGGQLIFMYKKVNRSLRLWQMVLDTITCRVRCWTDGYVDFIAVDPLLNYFAGYRTNAEAKAFASKSRFSVRLTLIRFLSPLAVLRDVFSVPCLLVVTLCKVPGQCDVCIGWGPWGGITGWLLRKFGKVRLLVYRDRDYEPGLVPDRLRQSLTAAIERFTIKRAELVICFGNLLADLRQKQTGRRIHVIPNGVEWDRFAESRTAKKRGHKLIYVGNLMPWCGIEHAIKAMPLIREAFPAAALVVVGNAQPGYEQRLQALVQRLDLDACVNFLGRRQHRELPALLAEAYIGLANSEPVAFRKYAYPLKVIEYMAAGLPVIGTIGTETENILKRCKCGVAMPYEIEALADAAIHLFLDRDLWAQMRENGIRESANMAWEKLVAEEINLISKCYEQVITKSLGYDRKGT